MAVEYRMGMSSSPFSAIQKLKMWIGIPLASGLFAAAYYADLHGKSGLLCGAMSASLVAIVWVISGGPNKPCPKCSHDQAPDATQCRRCGYCFDSKVANGRGRRITHSPRRKD